MTVCCMDAEDYSKLPLSQFEEDNILRELNKCLLAFQQKHIRTEETQPTVPTKIHRPRRLSPIGESMCSNTSEPNTQPQDTNVPLITQQSCSTNRSRSSSPISDNKNTLRVQQKYEKPTRDLSGPRDRLKDKKPLHYVATEGMLNNRRGRFIVLGSSGECLPVQRRQDFVRSFYSSVESSEEEFHSAKSSLGKLGLNQIRPAFNNSYVFMC